MLSRSNKIIKCLLFVFAITAAACRKEPATVPQPVSLTPYTITYPNYFPKLIIPADNPLTEEGIALGRNLYYDTLLSNNGLSCSSCHIPQQSFSSYGANSLPHINLAWNTNFLWEGKVSGTLEDAMVFEVEKFFRTDISKLNRSDFYRNEFKKVYQVEAITTKHVAYALAQFFRAMVSANSMCDKFFRHTYWLNEMEMRGFNLFTTERGDCFHCHSLGLFTDNKFHNIGLDSVFIGQAKGRYNITGSVSDIGLFKTPTLRNVALTAPYMHDGRFKTLEEVIEHYNSGVKHSSTLDPIMTKPSKQYGLGLTDLEKASLVAFLKTLTDTGFINNPMLQNTK